MSKNVYLEKSDIGATLTTWIYCGLWQLWCAENLGHTGYINWPRDRRLALQPYFDDAKFAEIPNMYEWYFEQPLFPNGTKPPRDLTWLWENCPEAGVNPLMGQPLSVIKAYYKKHLRFLPVVKQRGQAIVDRYKIDFKKTIGITWRGTDCVTDGRQRQPIEVYFPFIDEILAKEPDLRLACTAEETKVLDKLLARYPNAFVIHEFYQAPFGTPHNPERFSPMSGFERGMQPALMVWLFSQCAHYIKNRSSSGAVASWLSDGRIVCIAHAENLSYELLPNHAEVEGKRVQLQFP